MAGSEVLRRRKPDSTSQLFHKTGVIEAKRKLGKRKGKRV